MAVPNAYNLEVVPLIIDGQPATASPSVKFPVFSLEEQRDVYLAESADLGAVKRAADACLNSFKSWKKSSGVTRRRILQRYADLLRAHEEDLVNVQRLETSVIELWARKNVQLAADLVEEIAACVTRVSGEIPQTQTSSSLALAFSVPVGPVVVIAP
jgi:acyl-CoA reductase-like NAD-dependent aldehyde dehydrogenase